MSQNPRIHNFSEIKAPRELPTRGHLFRIYLQRVNSFSRRSQTWGRLLISVILVTFHPVTANFDRKPKWPVWSIRTTFMRWYLILATKKSVMDQNWNFGLADFGGVGKFKIQLWGPGWTFEGFYKTKMDFKNILEYSRPILNQISYIFIKVLMKIINFR